MLASEENGPCNATRVLALEEKRLGFAVLETEDLAVTTDVELALYTAIESASLVLHVVLSVSSSDRPNIPIVLHFSKVLPFDSPSSSVFAMLYSLFYTLLTSIHAV